MPRSISVVCELAAQLISHTYYHLGSVKHVFNGIRMSGNTLNSACQNKIYLNPCGISNSNRSCCTITYKSGGWNQELAGWFYFQLCLRLSNPHLTLSESSSNPALQTEGKRRYKFPFYWSCFFLIRITEKLEDPRNRKPCFSSLLIRSLNRNREIWGWSLLLRLFSSLQSAMMWLNGINIEGL